jgi:hypothetical protein
VQTEIQSVAERCRTCGTATLFAIVVIDQDEQGAERGSIRYDRLPHPTDECARMVRLTREEWPCLF